MMGHGIRRKPMSTLSLVRQYQSNGEKRSVNNAVFDPRMETKEAKLVEDKMCEINPNNFTTIEALPPEVLTHILQFLSPIERLRSERVCKNWRNAIRQTWRDVQMLYIVEPTVYEHHTFKDTCNPKLHELIEKEGNRLFIGTDSRKIIRCLVSRVGCFINKLTIDYFDSQHQQAIISIISRYCRNLKVLVLGMTDLVVVDEESLSRLFEFNQALHSVNSGNYKNCIEALPFRKWRSLRFESTDDCHEEKITSLIEYSEALEEFGCDRYTTRIVEALLKLRNLKSLCIITDPDQAPLEIILHVSLLNRLRKLEIQNYSDDLDSNMLCNVLQHCCQLKRLIINSRFQFYPVMLLGAIFALPNLETLGLNFCCIKDDILIHLTKFKNLSLEDFERSATDNGILQMIKKSEFLENLDIKRTRVTPEMFKQLIGVEEMRNRQKYLNVRVFCDIFDLVSEICAGSKIRVVKDMQCFEDGNSD